MNNTDDLRRELHGFIPLNPRRTGEEIRARAQRHRRRRLISVVGACVAVIILAVAVVIPGVINRGAGEQVVTPPAPVGPAPIMGPPVESPAFISPQGNVPTTIEEAISRPGYPARLTVMPQITTQGPRIDLGGNYSAWVGPPTAGVFGLPESAMKNPPAGAEPPHFCIQTPDGPGHGACGLAELNVRGPGTILATFPLEREGKYIAWIVGPVSNVIIDSDGEQLPVRLFNLGNNTGIAIADNVVYRRSGPVDLKEDKPFRTVQKITVRAYDNQGRIVAITK